MKKIAILANQSGGLYDFRKDLIAELEKHASVIVAVPHNDRWEELHKLANRVIELPVDRRGMNPLHDSKLFHQYRAMLKEVKPDLVLTYTIKPNIYGGLACRMAHIPYAVNITGLGSAIENGGWLKKFVLALYKPALRGAKVVFFENAGNRDTLVATGVVPNGRDVVLNGAGVNLKDYPYQPYPQEGPVRFLFVGRVMHEKGVDELFAAAKRIKHQYRDGVEFHIVGSFEEAYKPVVDELERTGVAKYHGYQDARGGGHFSGRVTAALVAGGALVLGALNRAGIEIVTHIGRCAGIGDTPFALDDPAALAAQAEALLNKSEGFALLDGSVEEPMKAAIRAAGAEGDSVGGVLETAILGLPAGVGEPYFDSVESKLAHLAFSIPAVKGIEFGSGFGFADQKGSEANDAFRMQGERIVTATNHNAGLNGGISNGMPVVFRTAVKPTPSIYKTQDTVDYMAKKDAELSIQGRHDPCIVPRAAIVQTCAAALAVGDLLTAKYGMAWMEDPTGYRKEVL